MWNYTITAERNLQGNVFSTEDHKTSVQCNVMISKEEVVPNAGK